MKVENEGDMTKLTNAQGQEVYVGTRVWYAEVKAAAERMYGSTYGLSAAMVKKAAWVAAQPFFS